MRHSFSLDFIDKERAKREAQVHVDETVTVNNY